ncbi:MAG: helix-turn-helix transcriptional regulator [Planktomarina sp.]
MSNLHEADVNSALLSIYECAIDPNQFDGFLSKMEAWLSNEATSEDVSKVEAVSEPVWQNVTKSHAQLAGLDKKPGKKPIFVLDGFRRSETPNFPDAWHDFQRTVQASDLTRLTAWMKTSPDGGETLFRRVDAGGKMSVYLAKKIDGRVQITDTETKLGAAVEAILIESFGVTHSEMSVLRHLVAGKAGKDISQVLGKSPETIRSQIKSLSQKLSVHRQQDIQRLVGDIQTQRDHMDDLAPPPAEGVQRKVMRDAGRLLFYTTYGSDKGFPVLICPDFSGGSHLPKGTAKAFQDHGLKALVLTRAGYGASDPVDL